MTFFKAIDIYFFIQVGTVLLASAGIIPRETILFSSALLAWFIIRADMATSVLLIARTIPVLAALPLTAGFDSLNLWRILTLILFLRWIVNDNIIAHTMRALKEIVRKARMNTREAVRFSFRQWPLETLLVCLGGVAVLSLTQTDDIVVGIKRIIYFLNLGMLFFVVRAYIRTEERLILLAKNILIGGIFIVVIGFLQLVMAYLVPIDGFAEFWALNVNQTLYGSAWAHIAVSANTWFAYYNETIHLRMFSSFPDTHSFPLYLLMVLCFSAMLFDRTAEMMKRKALFVFVAAAAMELVLSGTRGIWASAVFPFALLVFLGMRKIVEKKQLRRAALPLALFLVALPLSAPIFSSTQFLLKESADGKQFVFVERLKSIIDTGETSNQGRIFIWKESLRSAAEHPLLGVGIGNFPTVLKQNLSATKAGASAHNLYLHILAELGALGLLVFAGIVYLIMRRAWRFATNASDRVRQFFGLNALLYLTWILWYSMTDVAIFDERAFLLLMLLIGTLFGLSQAKTYPNEPATTRRH